MKKIGFIDYYISEWHANSYPKWIEEANATLGTDYKVAYAWAEMDKSPLDNVTTAEWCEKFGAEKCETIEELCEKSDVILILAPSNPETHLKYAKVALTYGKKNVVSPFLAHLYYVKWNGRTVFFVAVEYGLGQYHIFNTDEKTNQKLSLKIEP